MIGIDGARGDRAARNACSPSGAIRRIGAVPNHYALGLCRQRHVGVGRRRRQDRRDRRGGRERSTSSPIATSGRATRRCGRTICSPWCTAARATEVDDKVARIAALVGAAAARPRRPLLDPHPEEDRPAHRGMTKRGLRHVPAHPLSARNPRSRRRCGAARGPPGPVVIWNLIRRCNLTCKHCYSISGDVDFPGELTTAEVLR